MLAALRHGNTRSYYFIKVFIAFNHFINSFVCKYFYHIAATFSKAASRLKFYIHGQMVQVKEINHSQVSTDQRQAITIGREWDESDGSGWTGGNDLYGRPPSFLLSFVAITTTDIQCLNICF